MTKKNFPNEDLIMCDLFTSFPLWFIMPALTDHLHPCLMLQMPVRIPGPEGHACGLTFVHVFREAVGDSSRGGHVEEARGGPEDPLQHLVVQPT